MLTRRRLTNTDAVEQVSQHMTEALEYPTAPVKEKNTVNAYFFTTLYDV